MTSLFVYIVRGISPFFSSISCHLPFGNHAKTDIFPHNIQFTFEAAVQRSGASFRLTGDTKPILLCPPVVPSRQHIHISLKYKLHLSKIVKITPKISFQYIHKQKASWHFVQTVSVRTTNQAKYLYLQKQSSHILFYSCISSIFIHGDNPTTFRR